ncbi:MAG: ZIP family metal transporter [Clostridia bacterium]|nr:ZIP family metal transporter [Clostridia bacterium]
MGSIETLLIITAIAGVLGTGLGGLIGAMLQKESNRVVSLLLSFAAGVMLSVVCFDLVVEAIEAEMGIYTVILSISFGVAITFLLNYIIDKKTAPELAHIDEKHPKTADDLNELIHSDHWEHHVGRNDTKLSLFVAGVVMACAIALHNVPEGMAVSVPLISGGMKKSKAVLITASTGIPTMLGALLGYWIGEIGPLGLTLSLGFASGAMLYVVFGEILPQSILMYHSKAPAFSAIVGMLVGLLIIFA